MQGGLLFVTLGRYLCLMALLMVPSSILSVHDGDDLVADAFITASLAAVFMGALLMVAFRGAKVTEKLTVAMAGVIVAGTIVALVAGTPHGLLAEKNGFVAALFNGMSMLTTTGISSYADDNVPRAMVLWQAIMGWLGGFTTVVLALSILHFTNSGGIQLHKSPLPHGLGEGLYNRLMVAAKTLLPLYILATLVGFIALIVGPMGGFEAAVRSMGGISTHGFSLSDGQHIITDHWSQFILLLLMLFGALNLDYHYGWLNGQRRVYTQDSESLSFIRYLAIALLFLWLLTFAAIGREAFNGSVLFDGLFILASTMSTTGLILPDMSLVELPGVDILLISLVVLGGCVISTSGGIKIMRFVIVLRHLMAELGKLASPSGITSVKYARSSVADRDLEAVWLLGGGFLILVVFGTITLGIISVPFEQALPMAVAATSTTGPLVELVSPSFPGYVGLYTGEYITLSFLMLFGRIEVTLLLGLLVRAIWRR